MRFLTEKFFKKMEDEEDYDDVDEDDDDEQFFYERKPAEECLKGVRYYCPFPGCEKGEGYRPTPGQECSIRTKVRVRRVW